MEKIDNELRGKIYDCVYNLKSVVNDNFSDYGYHQTAFSVYKDIFGEYPSFDMIIEEIGQKTNYFVDDKGRKSVSKEAYNYDDNNPTISNVSLYASLYVLKEEYDEYCVRISKEFVVFKNAILYGLNYVPSIIAKDKETAEEVLNALVYYEEKNGSMYYVTMIKGDFTTYPLDVNEPSANLIEENYNSDLPNDKIKNILSDDNPSLLIFHGEPGTGKTTYIKYLSKVLDKKFYILDNSLLDYITSANFIEFIMRRKNSVFVIEDCETLLIEREKANNSISSLLNLTDGIIGNSLNSKFICTFNADIKNIDKALLRKGRLKIKYEFKKLNIDKTNHLQEKLGNNKTNVPMTLADIYNSEDNGSVVEKKKIGF